MPYAAFSGPIPVNLTMAPTPAPIAIAPPSGRRSGTPIHTRSPCSASIRHSHPPRHQRACSLAETSRWRATRYKLLSADAEQAQGPPVDPLEMGNPDIACIAYKISQAPYRPLFELVRRADFDITWPGNVPEVCATPNGAFGSNATPVTLSATDRTKATNIYDHWGQSLSFLERSKDISPFNSKFDFFLDGDYTLTSDRWPVSSCSTAKATAILAILRTVHHPEAGPDRHRHRGQRTASVHRPLLRQSRPAAQSQDCVVL